MNFFQEINSEIIKCFEMIGNRKIAIWGAGEYGEICAKMLMTHMNTNKISLEENSIVFLNKKTEIPRWGTAATRTLFGFQILHPDFIRYRQKEYFVITTSFSSGEYMKTFLCDNGYLSSDYFCLHSIDYEDKSVYLNYDIRCLNTMYKCGVLDFEKSCVRLDMPTLVHYCVYNHFQNYYDEDEGIYKVNGIYLPEEAVTPGNCSNYLHGLFCHGKGIGFRDSVELWEYSQIAEGLDCCKINGYDFDICQGDVVIDAGAYVGDSSCYASYKKATCYAFEPSEDSYKILKKTAALNGNIVPCKMALHSKSGKIKFKSFGSVSGYNHISEEGESTIEAITLDDFVAQNNLKHVDFLKSDIEGGERELLAGATRTLQQYAPKLLIATYHTPDDPMILQKIILKSNPNYIIYQHKHRLYAYVP